MSSAYAPTACYDLNLGHQPNVQMWNAYSSRWHHGKVVELFKDVDPNRNTLGHNSVFSEGSSQVIIGCSHCSPWRAVIKGENLFLFSFCSRDGTISSPLLPPSSTTVYSSHQKSHTYFVQSRFLNLRNCKLNRTFLFFKLVDSSVVLWWPKSWQILTVF